jgi:D-beta-D-heptose 7-phosphate kinase/D-beta-D-heptose 1-phosphate adenosyltransferase
LAALEFVEAVFIFEEDTPEKLIEALRPDVLVKGGDYTEDQIVGASFVRGYGGEVVILPYVEGYSTTGIIQKLCGG